MILSKQNLWLYAGESAVLPAEPVSPSSSAQPATALASPFADESSQETPPQRKKGRTRIAEEAQAEAKAAAAAEANGDSESEVKSGPTKPKRKGRKPKQAEARPAADAALLGPAAAVEAAGEAVAEDDHEAAAQGRLDMARKASTGDGSRLERPNSNSNDDTLNSGAASGLELQQHSTSGIDLGAEQQLVQEVVEVVHNKPDTDRKATSDKSRVFNPVMPVTKPPHRLSRVTGGAFNLVQGFLVCWFQSGSLISLQLYCMLTC